MSALQAFAKCAALKCYQNAGPMGLNGNMRTIPTAPPLLRTMNARPAKTVRTGNATQQPMPYIPTAGHPKSPWLIVNSTWGKNTLFVASSPRTTMLSPLGDGSANYHT